MNTKQNIVGRRLVVALCDELSRGWPKYEAVIVDTRHKRTKVRLIAPGDFWNNQVVLLGKECKRVCWKPEPQGDAYED